MISIVLTWIASPLYLVLYCYSEGWRLAKGGRVLSSCLLAALAMLAKETGLTALLAGLAYDLYRSWPHVRRALAEGRWNDEGLQFARRAAKALVAVSVLVSTEQEAEEEAT